MKNILVTGASGFVGTHLCRELHQRGETAVWGVTRRKRADLHDSHPGVQWLEGSYTDRAFWRKTIQDVRPQAIYHLAGQAQVTKSWEDPVETMTANVLAQTHMMEALREFPERPTILVIGSSEEYGLVSASELPVREETPFRPLSPYAVSKVAQDLMAFEYFRSYGFRVIRTRSFNHTGPGRPDSYAISNFSKQIALIESGQSEPVIRVGNLKAQRDYIDVRDMVKAYSLAVEKGESGEAYNICSGKPRAMEDVLQELLKLSSVKIGIQEDPARLRPADLPVIYGDASKFVRHTGWRPEISFPQMLGDLLKDWRQRIASGQNSGLISEARLV
jgi:GDP-4-dehydro-6-deoxy-D-mannose reductase